jgi:hypothetical protein
MNCRNQHREPAELLFVPQGGSKGERQVKSHCYHAADPLSGDNLIASERCILDSKRVRRGRHLTWPAEPREIDC